MGKIEDAIAELHLQEKKNIQAMADKHGVNRSTLSKRFNGKTGSKVNGYNSQKILTPGQERALINRINDLSKMGLPPSHQMVRNLALEIAGRMPGINWALRWVKHKSKMLQLGYLLPIDKSRKRADSALYYSLYFELLGRKMKEYDIKPGNTWNMDEKGFLIGHMKKKRRIFSRSAFELGRMQNVIQDGNREWITVVAAICADQTALAPTLIYQATTNNVQDTWLEDFNPDEHSCFFTSTPSRWTNDDLGLQWLKIFDKETKAKAKRDWRLLIIDGHGSHVNMKFIEYCDNHRILLAIYPPHSTHRLQPLDVSLFSPLAIHYSDELNQFLANCEGLSRFTKRDFFRTFWVAWEKAITPKNIASGWKKTGIHPWDPNAVLEQFNAKKEEDEERPSSSNSTGSILTAGDWKKIETRLKQVVEDVVRSKTDRRVRALTRDIHELVATNILLQSRIQGYREAFKIEQRKRKRQKSLFQILALNEGGRAIVYSPNKVREARELHQEKEDTKEADIARKAKDKEIGRASCRERVFALV